MYEFKKDDEGNVSIAELGSSVMSLVVRLFGFFLLMAGIWIAVTVMLHALELYERPTKIEELAVFIERGSNIDSSLASVRQGADNNTDDSTLANSNKHSNTDIRVSYFFAWMIAILLLLLVGRISLTAVKTGGELVLYDVQIKRFARELARESFKAPK